MQIERTHDLELVARLLAGLPAEALNARARHPLAVHLLVFDGAALAGLVQFRPAGELDGWRDDAAEWIGHFAALRGHGGLRMVPALRLALAWMWGHTAAQRIGGVPSSRAGGRVVRWAGLAAGAGGIFCIERPKAAGRAA